MPFYGPVQLSPHITACLLLSHGTTLFETGVQRKPYVGTYGSVCVFEGAGVAVQPQ